MSLKLCNMRLQSSNPPASLEFKRASNRIRCRSYGRFICIFLPLKLSTIYRHKVENRKKALDRYYERRHCRRGRKGKPAGEAEAAIEADPDFVMREEIEEIEEMVTSKWNIGPSLILWMKKLAEQSTTYARGTYPCDYLAFMAHREAFAGEIDATVNRVRRLARSAHAELSRSILICRSLDELEERVVRISTWYTEDLDCWRLGREKWLEAYTNGAFTWQVFVASNLML